MSFLAHFLMPQGIYLSWAPELFWLHVAADALLALACVAIAASLFLLAKRRPDLTFQTVLLVFGSLILMVGLTHFGAMWVMWMSSAWLQGWFKLLTGLLAAVTAALIWWRLPLLLNLQSMRQMEAVQAELRQTIADLEGFTHTVAHDLRAPLRAIDGYTRLALEDHGASLSSEGRVLLEKAGANARHMAILIDGLLNLASVDRTTVDAKPVEMTQLVREVLADSQTGRAVVHVGELAPARGDAVLISQVWRNLIENALKFSAHAPIPRVEIGMEPSGVYFVRDNGVGFDMAYAEKIFGVFERLHGVDEFPGTGLGLAIVKRIVSRHGGRVWPESSPGAGTTMRFTMA